MSNRFQIEKRRSLEEIRKKMPGVQQLGDWTLTMYRMSSAFQGKQIHCSLSRRCGMKDERIEWDAATYAAGKKEAVAKVQGGARG